MHHGDMCIYIHQQNNHIFVFNRMPMKLCNYDWLYLSTTYIQVQNDLLFYPEVSTDIKHKTFTFTAGKKFLIHKRVYGISNV